MKPYYGLRLPGHGLVAAGGSDFHRPDEGLRPGDTGSPPLPLDAIDRLLAA